MPDQPFQQPAQGGILGAPWPDGYLASYDCETTGVDVETDRIVTATLVVPGREPVQWLADPGIDIPTGASDLHGVTTEIARRDGAPAALVVDSIADALADELATRSVLVVMNAPYDLTLLDRECRRYELPTLADRLFGAPVGPIVDPLVLDRAADKYRKGKRNLEALCAEYGVDLTEAHTSAADAQAALEVALRIADRYPQLRVSAQQLHMWQVEWHRRWAAGFQQHLRKQAGNADTVIDGSWPFRPAPVAVTS
jgi:DNA polymerase-3 subunit epsilon